MHVRTDRQDVLRSPPVVGTSGSTGASASESSSPPQQTGTVSASAADGAVECDGFRSNPTAPRKWRLHTGAAGKSRDDSGVDLPLGADASKPAFFVTSAAKWWRHAYASSGSLLAEEADQLPVFWADGEEGAAAMNVTEAAEAAAAAGQSGSWTVGMWPAAVVTAFGIPSAPQHRPPPLCPSHRSHRMISRLVMPACSAPATRINGTRAAGSDQTASAPGSSLAPASSHVVDETMRWLRDVVAPAAAGVLPPPPDIADTAGSRSSADGWAISDVVCEARVPGHSSPPHNMPGTSVIAAGRASITAGVATLQWDRGTASGETYVPVVQQREKCCHPRLTRPASRVRRVEGRHERSWLVAVAVVATRRAGGAGSARREGRR